MTETTLPDDDELERIALASMPVVLDRIRPRLRRRRQLLITGTALVLTAGGAIAATLVINDPGDGIANIGQASTFALDCHDQDGAVAVSNVYADDPGTASSDPVATCLHEERLTAIDHAVSAAASKEHAADVGCGVVLVPAAAEDDEKRWTWLPDAHGDGMSVSDGLGSWADARWTKNCEQHTATIPLPPMPIARQVACAKAANWAEVFVSSGRSAASVCSTHGLPTWGP
ncbi:hypothetical protein [Curtobacterium sp. MCBD17_019]|uniref:hypothetical protein n=1 Tax=Curtobacterium sp. MCBD17_019 TaxID=2175669 RepID=UPI000DA81D54|nr:hypothetical protein [Curtobacterium sp. MCBD17_019]PZE77824.1 hypothetical protein DEI82_03225 [Curtobacterium sp. MCBD17_019]